MKITETKADTDNADNPTEKEKEEGVTDTETEISSDAPSETDTDLDNGTITDNSEPTDDPIDEESTGSDDGVPGFAIVSTLTILSGAGYALARWERQNHDGA